MAALLVLWEPQGAFYGGIIASPVFARLAEKVLPYLGVERKTQTAKTSREAAVPNVGNLTVEQATAQLQQAKFHVEVVGPGTRIIGQVPAPEARVDEGSLVYIYTDIDDNQVATDQPNPYGA